MSMNFVEKFIAEYGHDTYYYSIYKSSTSLATSELYYTKSYHITHNEIDSLCDSEDNYIICDELGFIPKALNTISFVFKVNSNTPFMSCLEQYNTTIDKAFIRVKYGNNTILSIRKSNTERYDDIESISVYKNHDDIILSIEFNDGSDINYNLLGNHAIRNDNISDDDLWDYDFICRFLRFF